MKIGFYATGKYQCRCVKCGELFQGDKRAAHCLECAVKELQKRHDAELQTLAIPLANLSIATGIELYDNDYKYKLSSEARACMNNVMNYAKDNPTEE